MRKKLLFFMALFWSAWSFGQSFTVGGINYVVTSATAPLTVKVASHVFFSGPANIPTTVTYNSDPYSVTSIGNGAFVNCRNLTSITIPNSVTSIGSDAFSICSSLTSVTIPNSVTSIGSSAFQGCFGLTSVTIGNSVTSIGNSAFYNCTNLTSVTIPNSVTSIGSVAFQGCTSLTSVTIPNSVTSIGSDAFKYTNLTSVTIPNSVTSIGSGVFQGSTSLTSVTIPNSVTSIGNSAFNNCTNLTSITIPNSVTSIGSGAFQGCTSLTSVTIPNSVTSIGNATFLNCTGLTSVTIGNSVTSIGINVFKNCTNLRTVNCYVLNPIAINFSVFENVNQPVCALNVPTGRAAAYDAAEFWTNFNPIIGNLNNAPIDISLSESAINENVAANSTVGTFSSIDADAANTFTYTLVAGTGSTDNASFTISGNSLRITASPDFETKSSYLIRVRTTDQDDLSFEKEFTITVNDLSYAPLLTFENINKTYGDANFDLGATSNSMGTISYSVVGGTGEVILSGTTNKTVELKTVGTVILRATQVAAGDYTSATKDITLTITAKPITVTADAKTKVYGATDPSLTYSVSPSLVGTDTFTGTLTRVAGENVSTYSIEQNNLSAGSNYTITYVAADFAITAKPITVTADAKTKVYATLDPVLTYSVSPSLVGTDFFTGTLSRVVGENAGTYAIEQGTLSAGANYVITYEAEDFAITAKPINVTADASQTKEYGTTDPSLTYSVSPSLLGTDSFTGTLSRVVGENAGTYAIAQGTLSAGANYTISFVSSDFTITAKPITITATAGQTKVYGTADPSLTYSVSPSLAGTDAFTGTLTRVEGENVGTYAIKQNNLSAGSNYTITYVAKDFAITAKPITVTADASQTKVYGTTDPSLTYSVSPSLLGTDAFTGSLTRVTGENVGTYAIKQNNLSAGSNYTIAYVAKDFAITAKPITVTADASQTKVYGTTDARLTYSVSPSLLGTDAFAGALSRTAGENVGQYAIAQGTLSAGANYVVTFVPANYSITKANQVITWNQTLVSDCGSSASIALTATSTSGLGISFSSSNSKVATIVNNELVFVNPGSATITASQIGDNNYNAASSIVLPIVNSQPNLIRKQFEDVIFFDNSSNEFVSYTWYKNGVVVAGQTAQYFKETGALNGSYYAVATKKDGTVIRTCPLVLTSNGVVETMNIAPNPVRSNSSYQLITNIEAAKIQNARVTVFNILGSLMTDRVVSESTIEMVAPSVEGIYIVKLTLSNGKMFTKNLLVRN